MARDESLGSIKYPFDCVHQFGGQTDHVAATKARTNFVLVSSSEAAQSQCSHALSEQAAQLDQCYLCIIS